MRPNSTDGDSDILLRGLQWWLAQEAQQVQLLQDEISAEERFYIGKILYGCLSCVKSVQDNAAEASPQACTDVFERRHGLCWLLLWQMLPAELLNHCFCGPVACHATCKAMKPEHAQGVSRIRKLQIQGASDARKGSGDCELQRAEFLHFTLQGLGLLSSAYHFHR